MRKLLKRVKRLFVDRKTWVRLILVSAIASGVAWQVGDILIKDGGVVAAIICALSIRISLYKSVREGFGQIVGTAIGAGVALACVSLFNFGIISVALTVLFCSVVARALHLGEVASVNVPVTALIVIGPGLSESTAFSRLSSTFIGAAVAIVFSYFSNGKTPAARTVDKISSLANKCAKLLGEMSEGVAAGYDQNEAGHWLAKARLLVEEIPGVRAQALEARGHAKWFPTAEVDEAEELYVRGVAVEHTVVQVRTIARTLFDSAVKGGIAEETKRDIAQALSAASYAVSSKAEQIKTAEGIAESRSATQDARNAGAALADSLMESSDKVDQEEMVRGISLASNIAIIADSLDESSPALHDVLTPGEPAMNQILKVSPLEQGARFGARISKPFIWLKKRFRNYF
ncbi:Aromatic acid exporter family member 1 [actinobacterium SCGC AAA044-D11]